jgi:DNA-binding transcriptional LysR family regulator
MRREDLPDLHAFIVVAEERSFTRAAARLGGSQSAISQTVRRLEERLGLRLLTRNTRSVAPTDAGARLLAGLRPALEEIDEQLAAVTALRERPAGAVRITTSQHAADTILWPAMEQLLPQYPDVSIEVSIDIGLRDIVADRFDAGVRLGEQVAKDMIAVRIGPDLRMAVVGSPSYFEGRTHPATPHDLTRHNCINLRFPTLGGLYAWEFEQDGRELNVRVDGQLTFNETRLIVRAALAGCGLAFVLEEHVSDYVADGRLMRVLADWCPPFSGYHLYYPTRRQLTPAFALLVDALKYRGSK